MMEGLSVFQDSQRRPNVCIIPSVRCGLTDQRRSPPHMHVKHRKALLEICEMFWVTESADWWFVAQIRTRIKPHVHYGAVYVSEEDVSANYRCLWLCVMQTIRSYCSLQWRALNLMAFSELSTVKWITCKHVCVVCVTCLCMCVCLCVSKQQQLNGITGGERAQPRAISTASFSPSLHSVLPPSFLPGIRKCFF